ncbi:MAG: hypothetical protein V4479_11570 [Actinomycetota bacterium]
MDDPVPTAWSAEEAPIPEVVTAKALEDRLTLIDRIVALEARLAEFEGSAETNPTETLNAEQKLVVMESSMQWRVGGLVTHPGRIFRWVTRRR